MTIFKKGLARHGSGFYHYCFRLEGVQFKGSTRARDLTTARKVLEEKRKLAVQAGIGQRPIPTLTELMQEWLRAHRSVHTPKHCKNVELLTRRWILPHVGRMRLNRLHPSDVQAIRSGVLEAGRSPVTANAVLRGLKLLLNFGVRQGYINKIPVLISFLKVQRKPRPTVPAIRIHDFFRAVDATARNPHVRVLLRVMVGMGLRESEALGMRWEWFDLGQRTYTVGKAKGKEARVIPVPDWLWTTIFQMPRTLNPWVFPAEDGLPHRAQFCKKALKRVCGSLGLGNVTQHRLRATFATLHAEAGTPLPEIQELLGHKEVTTTMIYIEQSLDAKRRAQDALSAKLGLAQ